MTYLKFDLQRLINLCSEPSVDKISKLNNFLVCKRTNINDIVKHLSNVEFTQIV